MNLSKKTELSGYLRSDGRKGIRNIVLVVYLVECAHHVARKIVMQFSEETVHLVGFFGCYPNDYADKMMNELSTHPNVGAVLLVSLGCESFNRNRLYKQIKASGRLVELVEIQSNGGTASSIMTGVKFVKQALMKLKEMPKVPLHMSELVIGIVSGGSDATSGITANPATGYAFDLLHALGTTTIFENTGEMIGLEKLLHARANKPELATILVQTVVKAAQYYAIMGHGSFAPGNAEGGLTTLEEKSMGAYCKSGSAPIIGLLKPADRPTVPGLYLMDIVPDGQPRFGFPNPNDIGEMNELIASGAHIVLFTTGRGSVAGSAIAPVIKICANPDTYLRMQDDMDVNAGKILTGTATVKEVAEEIVELVFEVIQGRQSRSENLGHQEFSLAYKGFEPLGPSCLP